MKKMLFLCVLVSLFMLIVQNIWAQIPKIMSYQGQLTDNDGKPVSGPHELIFSIYDVDEGGVALWGEVHPSVDVADGTFNVILGSGNPLNLAFDKQYWLGISINAALELRPRIQLTASPYSLGSWRLGGNSDTDPDANFLGTIDGMPLALRVNSLRALFLIPGDSPSIIGGFNGNFIEEGLSGVTISGGGEDGMVNSVIAGHGTIGGGKGNTVNGAYGTIGGGWGNSASTDSTVGGGGSNTANGSTSTVGGGQSNIASGGSATVPGGANNTALGDYSFAAGRRAKANHAGSFVWGDSVDSDVTSTIEDQFVVRANGGVRLSTGAGGQFLHSNNICPNIRSGFNDNAFGSGVVGAAIGGGGVNGEENIITDNYGVIGGGKGNQAGDNAGDEVDATHATVSGGWSNIAGGMHSAVGGGWNNNADAFCATIGGGGRSDVNDPNTGNRVTDNYGTIGGGGNNQAGDGIGLKSGTAYATVGGGWGNTASGGGSFVGGGWDNTASWQLSTVGGGKNNTASNWGATVCGGGDNIASESSSNIGGGTNNTASGGFATICGGWENDVSGFMAIALGGCDNLAQGDNSLAAGQLAKVTHEGAFVWSDSSQYVDFDSIADHEFAVRCSGGAHFVTAFSATTGAPTTWAELAPGSGAWAAMSDRNVKENFIPIDNHDILERLANISLENWNYKSQDPSIRHIGPVAQDFYAAFGLGADDKHITTIDADGVALAAIQELYELVKEKDERIATLEDRITALEAMISASAHE